MSTDIESALRGLKQVLTNVAAGSSALPNEVQRNASLRDMFGQITGTSKAYLNLIDDDPVPYDTIIGPGGNYYEEFGQRAVLEFIVMEVNDATRDAVFAEGLAEVARGLRLAKEQLPLLAAMDILPPERANLAAGPLPGIKAVRITVEWLVTAPDMLGNILADRATATIEPILMSSDAVRDRGATLVGAIDPILSAGQVATMLDAQLTGGIDAVLSGSAAAVRLLADAAPGVADILGTGDADVLVGVTGAGIIGNILGAGDASVQQSGLGGVVSIEPILGSGSASADIDGSMSGVVAAVLGSGTVFTNPGANIAGWIDPILSAGQMDVQIAAQSAGAVEALLGAGAVAVNVQANASANVEAILSSGQAGQPQAVFDGSGVVGAILGAGAAKLLVTNDLTGALDPILGSGAASLAVSGAGAGLIDPILSQAAADQLNEADAAANVDPILSAGAAAVHSAASSTASVDAILGSGTAAARVQASSAGLIGSILGTGAGVVVGGGGSNEPETDTLLAAMTVAPDATLEGHINTLIAGLKADGRWSDLEIFYILAVHDAQAATLNWKDPASFVASGTGSFIANGGLVCTSSGGTMKFDPGFTWGDRTIMSPDDAHGAVAWSSPPGTGSNRNVMAFGNNTARMNSNGTPGAGLFTRFNSSGGTAVSPYDNRHFIDTITVADGTRAIIDGVEVNTTGQSLDTPADTDVFAGGFDKTLVALHLGRGLTNAQAAQIHARISTFMTSVGVWP